MRRIAYITAASLALTFGWTAGGIAQAAKPHSHKCRRHHKRHAHCRPKPRVLVIIRYKTKVIHETAAPAPSSVGPAPAPTVSHEPTKEVIVELPPNAPTAPGEGSPQEEACLQSGGAWISEENGATECQTQAQSEALLAQLLAEDPEAVASTAAARCHTVTRATSVGTTVTETRCERRHERSHEIHPNSVGSGSTGPS